MLHNSGLNKARRLLKRLWKFMLVSTLQYKFPIIDLLGHIRVAPLHIHSTEREFKLIEMISISRSTRVKLHACICMYARIHSFIHSNSLR
jgi:hypothetical protein